MKHIITFFSIILLINQCIFGQSLDDAARLSFYIPVGSARVLGAGNAMSALGADAGLATMNPASTAEYRSSEVTISMGFPYSNTSANLNNVPISVEGSSFGINQFAIVLHHRPIVSRTKSINLVFGMNKLIDYYEEIEYSGISTGSIVERYVERANTLRIDQLDPFEAGPAFSNGAIVDFDEDLFYESDFGDFQQQVSKSQIIVRKGAMREYFLNLGSNYDEKISWGITLGFPHYNFTEESTYDEEDTENIVSGFESLFFDESLKTTGLGINTKLGVNYKINQKVRVGGAFHSPTYFFLNDNYQTTSSYTFNEQGSNNTIEETSPESDFDFRFSSPWRASGNVGLIFSLGNIKGFVAGDVEYISYTSNNFNLTAESDDPFDAIFEAELNTSIDNEFANALNFRLGGEIAVSRLRLRAGAMALEEPYANSDRLLIPTAGIGYRGNNSFIDVAFVLRNQEYIFSPYSLSTEASIRNPQVDIESQRMELSITAGIKL